MSSSYAASAMRVTSPVIIIIIGVLAHGRPLTGDSHFLLCGGRPSVRPLARCFTPSRDAPPRTAAAAAAALGTRTGGGVLLPRHAAAADPGRGDGATPQCRSIRGPRNTHGPLRFASVMCVISSCCDRPAHPPQRQQPDSSAGSTTLGTSCGPHASSY